MAFSAYRTWVAGDVLTAAQLNQDIRDNGNHVYGSAVSTFSPTLTQSGSVSLTTATGRYQHVGYWCRLHIYLDPSGTGTGANDMVVGNIPAAIAPRTAAAPSAGETMTGSFLYFDTGSAQYTGTCCFVTTSTLKLAESNTVSGSFLGTSPNIAVAATDFLQLDITYETASASA